MSQRHGNGDAETITFKFRHHQSMLNSALPEDTQMCLHHGVAEHKRRPRLCSKMVHLYANALQMLAGTAEMSRLAVIHGKRGNLPD
jgi:hypothetical protein